MSRRSHNFAVGDRITRNGYGPGEFRTVTYIGSWLIVASRPGSEDVAIYPQGWPNWRLFEADERVPFSSIFGLLEDDESFDPEAYLDSARRPRT